MVGDEGLCDRVHPYNYYCKSYSIAARRFGGIKKYLPTCMLPVFSVMACTQYVGRKIM